MTQMQLIKKYQISAKKRFGQNFLIDQNVVSRIVDSLEIKEDDFILEIGPGLGALTGEILKKTKNYLGYEIDLNLGEILKKEYGEKYFVVEDFLKADPHNFLEYKSLKIVGNLPYYITSDIILKVLRFFRFTSFSLMVQKEFGERLLAKEGSKLYGSLSVVFALLFDLKEKIIVKENSFYPTPKVQSIYLSVSSRKNDLNSNLNGNFLEFVHLVFQNRRKQLFANLKRWYQEKTETIEKFYEENEIKKETRIEELSPSLIYKLYEVLNADKS